MHDFFANTDLEWGYQPSHDGSMIAWFGVDWTKTVIRIKRTDMKLPFVTLSGAEFESFDWHPFRNELLARESGRQWLINPEKPSRQDWIDVTPRGFQNWRIVSSPGGPDDLLMVASNDRNPAFFDLYTIRQDGGGKKLLEENGGKTLDWWLNDDNVAVLQAERLDNGATLYQIRDNASTPWRTFTEAAAKDNFSILNAPAGGAPIYALSDRGRFRIALVTVDPKTGNETVVANHAKVDARTAFFIGARQRTPDFVSFEPGYPEHKAITEKGANFLKLLLDGRNPVDFTILGSSQDGRFVTVARSWREQSHEYFLYDLISATAVKIGEFDLRRYKNILSETKPVSFKARDGLDIPALLITPKGIEPRKLPTIVHIHGGPAYQQLWRFDDDFQFLANRGYAILSVNFRGSTGYGKAFRSAGYRQFGKAMQDDIVDAANWLVKEGVADRENMAVMGAATAATRLPWP